MRGLDRRARWQPRVHRRRRIMPRRIRLATADADDALVSRARDASGLRQEDPRLLRPGVGPRRKEPGYSLIGIGFGFANAPVTNTAVSGLPPTRAGVAGAITSTARQFGSALGIALAGGLVADTSPTELAHASRPGWILVATCGLFMFLVAHASRPKKDTVRRTFPQAR